jgi:hypothetical protein
MMPEPSKDHEGLSAWWAVREVDSLFARLGRYTRFVVYGKWSLAVVAMLLMATLIIWPLVTKDTSGIRVSFVDKKTVKAPPTSPVMSNPEYSGNGSNGQQYKIVGKTATQKTTNLVIIEGVEASLTKQDGSWNILTAERAEYLQDKKTIDLFGNVTVVDAQGSSFITSHATIDVQQSRIYGKERITGEGKMGKLGASGFEIINNGERITFVGGAQPLTVNLRKAAKKQ